MKKIEIGDKIEIIEMKGEPDYTGRTGVVRCIDAIGQIHGSWGGLALNENDIFIIIGKENDDDDVSDN